MKDLIIRKATSNDMDDLLRFEQGVITAERAFDPTLKIENVRYYDLHYMIASAHIELLVAETNTRLIGSGYARIENAKPYLQHQQYAYLGFMYVEPDFRGMGVNKAIIDALQSWSAEQGITEIRLEVYYGNSPAIRAYEKAGFSRHMIEMRKGLGKE